MSQSNTINTLEKIRDCFQSGLYNVGNQCLILNKDLLAECGELVKYIKMPELCLEHINSIELLKDRVEIAGATASFLNVTHTVTLIAKLIDGNIILKLVAKNPEKWKFSDSFPNIPSYIGLDSNGVTLGEKPSFFNELAIQNSCFIISTVNDTENNIIKGVNFRCDFTINEQPPFDSVIKNIIGTKTLSLNGFINLNNNVPVFQFKAPIQGLAITIGHINLNDIYLDLQTIEDPSQSIMCLNGKIHLAQQVINVSVPLLQGNFIWSLNAEFPDNSFSLKNGFQELSNLANVKIEAFRLPDPINELTSLYLSNLAIGFNPNSNSLDFISTTVKFSKSWNTGIPKFNIENIAISWLFAHQNSYASLSGTLAIGQGKKVIHLDVEAHLPELIFEINMRYGDEIYINELLSHFIGNQADFDQNLIIDQLSLRAYFNTKTYNALAIAKNLWTISLGKSNLTFDNLSVDIEYSQSTTLACIAAQFSFKLQESNDNRELRFFLIGQKDSTGWQFSGSTGLNQEIKIESLIPHLGKLFGDITLPLSISDLTIQNVSISFNTAIKDFSFTCKSYFMIDDQKVNINVIIKIIRQQNNSFKKEFSGYITIRQREFALIFNTEKTSKNLISAYHDTNSSEINVKELIGDIYPRLKEDIPDELRISLKDALFAYSKQPTLTNFLFGLNIGGEINLSNLPLVGREFPPNQTLKISLQVLVTKANFTATELQTFNTLYTEGGIKLPTTDLNKRLELIPSIQLGSEIQQLELPIPINEESGQIEETTHSRDNNVLPSVVTTSSSPTQISDSIKWFKLQKSFGPVHFQKIGVKYQDQKLWFLLDASLATAGLTISLDGLAVSSPLTTLDPKFHLNGIGIDYRSQTVEIGGAFLRKQVERDGKLLDEYDGTAILRTQTKKGKALTLSALGSYMDNEGHPSLFVYALLDYPLGGAPFLFITGLAAAFGYNRTLRLPDKVQDVAQFPLVKSATERITDIEQVRKDLSPSIPPATGEIFFAVGIKFTSFKIIDSFALLTVQLGNRSEINILGLSTLIAPPQIDPEIKPVAKAQLAFRATYLPDEGFLKAEAALLPGAYLFSDKCHLIGQFAFYSWFSGEHEGDFVLTLGGYHPDFEVPEHYPKLPRLQLNWQVDEKTLIKGDAYFALCAHALMAGGHLDITYESGNVKAWLRTEANFLIAWKPYHYDAHIHVTIGASYTYHLFGTHHITAEVGADLHLWGPDFGGTASIDIGIVQIDINFGSHSSQQLKPIDDWKAFKDSFLPKDDEVCSVAVQDGLVRKIDNDKSDLGVINPKHFSLVTNSVIPSNKSVIQEITIFDNKHQTIYFEDKDYNQPLPFTKNNSNNFCQTQSKYLTKIASPGIRAMAIPANELITTHTIKITINGKNVEDNFQYIPILKKVPVALWGEPPFKDKPLMPDVNGQQFIENALSGFEIKPKQQPGTAKTHAIDRSQLQFNTGLPSKHYKWEDIKVFTPMSFKNETEEEKTEVKKRKISTIITEPVKNTRNGLLEKLGISLQEIEKIDLSSSISEDFLILPQIEE